MRLVLDNVDLFYNRVHALRELSLVVEEGEIVSLLGNNGAGKTSTLSLISGLVKARSGTVTWGEHDLTRMRPWDMVGAGLIHVPEGRRIFSTMTVHENLLLGGYLVPDQGLVRERADHAYELMPRLAERRMQQGGTLSGGEQQMLAVGRALVSGPRLLLLDEPSMGLAPLLVEKIFEVVQSVAREGVTVLLVEQNARLALEFAGRGYVMASGRLILTGSGEALLADPGVRAAYLGEAG